MLRKSASADKDGTLNDPVETELKFQLRIGSRRALKLMPEFSASKVQRLHLLTTYYDTPDCVLKQAGLTLRVRANGDLRIQTVKSEASGSDVALSRNEWEWTIEQNGPDLRQVAAIPRLAQYAKNVEGRLQPMFVTDIRRAVHLLQLDDGSIVEAAFDVGQVRCDGQSEPIKELELELKQGSLQSLYRFALRMHEQTPLFIFAESKTAKGWRLRIGRWPPARPACEAGLTRDDDVGEAFRKVMRSSLGHLVANIAPTMRGDPEGLHQMRIALRACRASLEFFAPALSRRSTKRLARKVRRFGRKFGQTRDWDVLCTQTIPTAKASLPIPLDEIAAGAARARTASHRKLEHMLRSRSFTSLVLSLAVEVRGVENSPTEKIDTKQPFLNVAATLFDRVLAKIEECARDPERLSPNGLHGLRKVLDRLFDDMTFVQRLYPKRRLESYREKCQALQEILGASNDAVVTRKLIRKLDRHGPRGSQKPCKRLVSWSKERRKEALRDLERTVGRFRSATPFWRVAVSVPNEGVVHDR